MQFLNLKDIGKTRAQNMLIAGVNVLNVLHV